MVHKQLSDHVRLLLAGMNNGPMMMLMIPSIQVTFYTVEELIKCHINSSPVNNYFSFLSGCKGNLSVSLVSQIALLLENGCLDSSCS